ncbi:hypothetical protein FRX31_014053 [Thalictrum thalictroides]|uniref:Uncharacterized protein n=1 Tax=Thalictrum thalictroides TaxID=46969 RepID=A0A7J6WHI2_THATH|nr:hypothetical protein FRX31_014053 [Thalictrum thalictroides]
MTTSPGFRPPHFSEDIAWLPEWLQPHQETSGDHHTNGTQTPSNTQTCKVQGKIACETDVNLFARKDAGYNNCQLFLSGSDNSPAGMTPSGNVLHLYLHLSSNGVSQYTQSPVYTALPKERDESNGNPSMKPLLETSGCPQDQSVQNSMEVNNSMSHGHIKSNSRRFVKSRSSSLPTDNNISGKKHKIEVNCSNQLNVDITNSVELCIAASEALVVSETVNSVSASEVLPASAVLEVALNVKQARRKLCPIRLENISNCVADVVDETDLLQDLDEDSMADAYEDVGLSQSSCNYS